MLEQNRAELEKSGALWWHERGYRGKGVTIGILDSGGIRSFQKSSVDIPFEVNDTIGHGAYVVATFLTFAPEARVIYGRRNTETAQYCLDQGVQIFNISGSCSPDIYNLIKDKAIVFASVGNVPSSNILYPANQDLAIGTASYLVNTDKPAYNSTPGEAVDITAFSNIEIPLDESGNTKVFSGTSAASPFAAGLLSLWLGACWEIDIYPTLQEMRDYVFEHTEDVHDEGRDDKTGRGLFVLGSLPKRIQLKISSKDYLLNGEIKTMDTAAVIDKNNRLLTPARVVAEGLGARVAYDNDWEYEIDIIML